MTVTDDASYIGDDYWVGGAFDIGGKEIWAAQRSVSIIDKQDATFVRIVGLGFESLDFSY